MTEQDFELRRILDLLRENPKGMKISQIAGKIPKNRNSVAKYLEILLMTHQVEMLRHGMSKIYRLSRSTGIPTMLDASPDSILTLDKSLKIVSVNDNYLEFFSLDREEVVGRHPAPARLPVLSLHLVLEKLREAGYGTGTRAEVKILKGGSELYFDVRITPAVFSGGEQGITVILEDITERKKGEIFLRESASDFRTLFGALSAGMAVCDPSGHLVEANSAFFGIFGVAGKREFGNCDLFSLFRVSPESLAALRRGSEAASVSVVDLDLLKPRSGNPPARSGKISVDIHIAPINLKAGGAGAGYFIQANEADSRVLSVIDHVPDPVARFSRDMKYLYTNRGAEAITGLPPGTCIGRTNSELGISGEYAIMIERGAREVFRTGQPATIEFSARCADGLRRYRTNIMPETGKTREVLSVIAVSRDITKTREAAPATGDSLRILEEILSCVDEAIILLNSRASTICFANKAAELVFGYSAGDLCMKDPLILLGCNGTGAEHLNTLQAAFLTSGSYEAESQLKRSTGERFPAKRQFRPICDDEGRVSHIVAVIRDESGRFVSGEAYGFTLPARIRSRPGTYRPCD
ncbi:MAG: PAS domain S-box protein [Methanoregulaceae archaeon]|nr:PAS domain S-box protein [Methanoregulaceae archaeon]